jgi:hypothetical protein
MSRAALIGTLNCLGCAANGPVVSMVASRESVCTSLAHSPTQKRQIHPNRDCSSLVSDVLATPTPLKSVLVRPRWEQFGRGFVPWLLGE